IAGALAECGLKPADIAHFCLPCTLPRVVQGIAKQVGLPEASVRPNLDGLCGDTGTAHPLVMLVHALQEAKPGERILWRASATARTRSSSRRRRRCRRCSR